MADEAPTGGSGIPKRFRDFSVDVREERVIRYIVKQLGLDRHVDDIMRDPYIVAHTNDASRAAVLQQPQIIHGLEEQIRRQFADYRSVTGTSPEEPEPD